MARRDSRSRHKRKPKDGPARRKQVLTDHEKRGKTLLPPLVAAMGDSFSPVSWLDDLVPELLWIQLLIDQLGLRTAVDLAGRMAEAVREQDPDAGAILVTVSDFSKLSDASWQALLSSLGDDVDGLRRSLWPLVGMYPDCPLGKAFDDSWRSANRADPDAEIPYLKRVVRDVSAKTSDESTLLIATATYLWGLSGKLHFAGEMEPWDLNELTRDLSSPESKKIAASLRASVNVLGGRLSRVDPEWLTYFWRQGLAISLCEDSGSQHSSGEEGWWDRYVTAGHQLQDELATELQRI